MTKKQTGKRGRRKPAARTSWDSVAQWYDGWVGRDGSKHHQKVAIPAVMDLLALQQGDSVLDVGAGQGVLAPYVTEAGATYTGLEASPSLRQQAVNHHGKLGTFLLGDATKLQEIKGLRAGSYDAAVFLLSIQDMDPLQPVLAGAAWALKPDGRLVLLMTHPAFRVPRQSGWGWDENRKLRFRRLDSYMTPLPVPMKSYHGGHGTTRSFHRPLHMYVNGMAANGLWLDRMLELPTYKGGSGPKAEAAAEKRANEEFPLFLGLRARKVNTA